MNDAPQPTFTLITPRPFRCTEIVPIMTEACRFVRVADLIAWGQPLPDGFSDMEPDAIVGSVPTSRELELRVTGHGRILAGDKVQAICSGQTWLLQVSQSTTNTLGNNASVTTFNAIGFRDVPDSSEECRGGWTPPVR